MLIFILISSVVNSAYSLERKREENVINTKIINNLEKKYENLSEMERNIEYFRGRILNRVLNTNDTTEQNISDTTETKETKKKEITINNLKDYDLEEEEIEDEESSDDEEDESNYKKGQEKKSKKIM